MNKDNLFRHYERKIEFHCKRLDSVNLKKERYLKKIQDAVWETLENQYRNYNKGHITITDVNDFFFWRFGRALYLTD